MAKVLTFEVAINELENKIWRKIEITDKKTVADLAYTILATFGSLAYHLYEIKYKENIYDCWIDEEEQNNEDKRINAIETNLSSLNLKENDVMEMIYDISTPTTFKIKYLGLRELEKGRSKHYPCIIDGAGNGMLDDLCDFELKEIVDDIDKKGYSEHFYTPGYERTTNYDYREYNIKKDNKLLKSVILDIKNGYEDIDE